VRLSQGNLCPAEIRDIFCCTAGWLKPQFMDSLGPFNLFMGCLFFFLWLLFFEENWNGMHGGQEQGKRGRHLAAYREQEKRGRTGKKGTELFSV